MFSLETLYWPFSRSLDYPATLLKRGELFRGWMDGTFDVIDPDEVDAEVGNFWRTLYKLEKTFANQANPEAMAGKVRGCLIGRFINLAIRFHALLMRFSIN